MSSSAPSAENPGQQTLVMGVLNITEDSFSDGGKYLEPAAALAHAEQLYAEGADIIDIGGESTRPGAKRVPGAEERRVIPIVAELVGCGQVISVDTMRAEVARAASELGARYLNDVSGGRADPTMPEVMAAHARRGGQVIIGHWATENFGDAAGRALSEGEEIVTQVCRDLTKSVERLRAAGVPDTAIILDPGLGFAKNASDNWNLLGQLDRLKELGFPLLIGASRKRFLSALRHTPEPDLLLDDAATAALSALMAAQGVWGVRVHNVALSRAAISVAAQLRAHGTVEENPHG